MQKTPRENRHSPDPLHIATPFSPEERVIPIEKGVQKKFLKILPNTVSLRDDDIFGPIIHSLKSNTIVQKK